MIPRIDIELTERCNNQCVHCYNNQPVADGAVISRELDTAAWKEILQQAADLGALTVKFTGGEPLLRDDFKELYIFARRLGMKVQLFTNGRLITPQLAALLSHMPPLEKVEVTLYGTTPESYEAVSRVEGSFKQALRGIELLKQELVPFIVKGVVLPQNREDLPRLDNFCQSVHGMDTLPAITMFLEKRARRDCDQCNRRIETMRPDPQQLVQHIVQRYPQAPGEWRQLVENGQRPPGPGLFQCGAGTSVSVDAYGSAQPCLSLRTPELCFDLAQGSTEEALRHFKKLETYEAKHPEYIERCSHCFLKSLCEQCPARSWSEHGNLDQPVDYLCRLTHAQAVEAGILREGEKGWLKKRRT
jgi:radical SAM protein with 4Fe4S-binding SPASM domain